MAHFPDQMFYAREGHVFPWDVRFDPADRAHLARTAAGRIRFRLVTEPVFSEANVVFADGSAAPLECCSSTGRFQVWQAEIEPPATTFRYTFALLGPGDAPVYRVPAGVSNAVERLDRWSCDVEALAPITSPEWAHGAVIYQIFPDRFRRSTGAPPRDDIVEWGAEPEWLEHQGGDLHGIAEGLPHLAELGVDMLYLNPIFTAPSTHRYDAIDYFEVDPMLGGNAALRELVEAAHAHDIRVILDASFNHCHPSFFAFADVIERGFDSPYVDWFVVDRHPIDMVVRPDVIRERWDSPEDFLAHVESLAARAGIPVRYEDGDGLPVEIPYDAWYGVPSLPRVDLSNPEARAYFLGVARHWIEEFDIDGWRMDVARYVDADFWPDFRDVCKQAKPDCYLLCEVMGDAVPWLQGDMFDATMNYTLRRLVMDWLVDRRIGGAEFNDGLARMYAMIPTEMALAGQNLIGSHDKARFLRIADDDHETLRLATILQLLVPGAPGIYYGDEIAVAGSHDIEGREPFPWHDEDAWNERQLSTVRELTQLRRVTPALRLGDFRPVWADATATAFLRCHDGERVLVVVSTSGSLRTRLLVASERATVLWGEGDVMVVDDAMEVTVRDGALVVAC